MAKWAILLGNKKTFKRGTVRFLTYYISLDLDSIRKPYVSKLPMTTSKAENIRIIKLT